MLSRVVVAAVLAASVAGPSLCQGTSIFLQHHFTTSDTPTGFSIPLEEAAGWVVSNQGNRPATNADLQAVLVDVTAVYIYETCFPNTTPCGLVLQDPNFAGLWSDHFVVGSGWNSAQNIAVGANGMEVSSNTLGSQVAVVANAPPSYLGNKGAAFGLPFSFIMSRIPNPDAVYYTLGAALTISGNVADPVPEPGPAVLVGAVLAVMGLVSRNRRPVP
ncbi:MAG: hypothetical protein HY820_39275 [Acidobacteria bacterium]|nr:hypothetical protein [Acidobacteriota bacterium]